MVEVIADQSTLSKLGLKETNVTESDAKQILEKANTSGTMQATLVDNTLDVNQLLID